MKTLSIILLLISTVALTKETILSSTEVDLYELLESQIITKKPTKGILKLLIEYESNICLYNNEQITFSVQEKLKYQKPNQLTLIATAPIIQKFLRIDGCASTSRPKEITLSIPVQTFNQEKPKTYSMNFLSHSYTFEIKSVNGKLVLKTIKN